MDGWMDGWRWKRRAKEDGCLVAAPRSISTGSLHRKFRATWLCQKLIDFSQSSIPINPNQLNKQLIQFSSNPTKEHSNQNSISRLSNRSNCPPFSLAVNCDRLSLQHHYISTQSQKWLIITNWWDQPTVVSSRNDRLLMWCNCFMINGMIFFFYFAADCRNKRCWCDSWRKNCGFDPCRIRVWRCASRWRPCTPRTTISPERWSS